MTKETAFWEAIIAVAPLLGLTIVVELRAIRWRRMPAFVRGLVLGYLATALVLLAAATSFSLHVLQHWDNPSIVGPWDTTLIFIAIQLAIGAVLIYPLSRAVNTATGPVLHPRYRRMKKRHKAKTKRLARRLDELKAMQHHLRIEFSERVLANPGGIFETSASGIRVNVTDAVVVKLTGSLRKLLDETREADKQLSRWRRKSRRRLEATKKHLWTHPEYGGSPRMMETDAGSAGATSAPRSLVR